MSAAIIAPHGGGQLAPLHVADDAQRKELAAEARSLPGLVVDSAAAANAVMLGAGYFNPLGGYQGLAECLQVAQQMRTLSGLFWPVPVACRLRDAPPSGARRLALLDPNAKDNPPLAILELESVDAATDAQVQTMAGQIFGTLDLGHPGVRTFCDAGRFFVGGGLQVLNYSHFPASFPDSFMTAGQIRAEIARRGWRTAVAFQTRNPMHRAHEELCRMAMERLSADGCIVHMLLGKLKSGDIPAKVREDCINAMVRHYFEPGSVLVCGYGFDMLYAGPREALLHALFRQNMGASHLIVGRDHAGVGDYYGAFDAQAIFDRVPDGALQIQIFRADHTAWSRRLGAVVMMNEAEDHSPDDFILLSGTRVREMLAAGEPPPPEFTRPEVAQILMRHYRQERPGA